MEQTMTRPVVVGLGELLWDLLPSGRQLGGAPANFAYHAQALGALASVVSAVGTDALGDEAVARLKGAGREARHLSRDPAHPTGTVSVELLAGGQPRYVIHTEVAWDHIPFTAETERLARNTAAVCFGSLAQRGAVSRDTIRRFLATVPEGALRLFDINLRQAFYSAEVIRDSLEASTILKLNDEELPRVAELLGVSGDERSVCRALAARYGLRLVALTRGAGGSLLVTPESEDERAAEPVKVVDTVGAGDCFSAALAMGLLAGWPLERIHRRASRLAAYVCSQSGAMPTLPDDLMAPA
jgi:fructokinase